MKTQPPTLWVTRTSPFNLLTAQRLRGMGLHVLTIPLLEVRQLPCDADFVRPDLLAFTSVHGVRHHPFQNDWADVPVLAVGDTTAAAARRRGYRDVRSARGAVADLQALALRSAASGSQVIHFGALEPAGDLAGYLAGRGFDVLQVAVYETAPCIDGADMLLAGRSRVDAVLVHSPKAGRLLARLIEETGWTGTALCLSEACADTLRHLPDLILHSAAEPNEKALLKVVAERFDLKRPALIQASPPGHRNVIRAAAVPAAHFANDNLPPPPLPA